MGLDMYLSRKKYIGANYEHRKVTGSANIMIGDKKIPINFKQISYVEEQVCYWRKANQIHKWFVDNVQDGNDDCRQYWVSVEKLEELLKLCKEIKEKAILKDGKVKNGEKLENGKWIPIMEDGKYIENAEEIANILPTSTGCFFGSSEYDEYYMYDIEHTIEQLEKILKEEKELNKLGFYSDYEYQASW